MKRPYDRRDRVLWILAQKGGSITLTELRRSMEIKHENLDHLLSDLENEGRIKRTELKGKQLISLKNYNLQM